MTPSCALRCSTLLTLFCCVSVPSQALDREVVLAVYQGVCQEGDFEANLATVRKEVEVAKARGSHFVVFPECFLSGYESREAGRARCAGDSTIRSCSSSSPNRPTHDMVVLVGLARQAADGLYNTELVIHGGKLLGFFDKVMLTPRRSRRAWFQAGHGGAGVPGPRGSVCRDHLRTTPRFRTSRWRHGCRGRRSSSRRTSTRLAAVAADDHRRWVRNCHVGLASQLKMVVARANNVKSTRAGQIGYGDSFILSPQGTPLAEADLFKTELITATITPDMFRSPWVWGNLNDSPAWLRTQLGQLLTDFRRPANDMDLRSWLENMVVFHRFTPDEVSAATGLTPSEVAAALRTFDLVATRPRRAALRKSRCECLPYPGGRHPRLGFFEGAVMPQRETKVSVFTPWDDGGYVVVDVPEAIFSNLGLTYLAHTHIPTIWDLQGVTLPRLEWQRHRGRLTAMRTHTAQRHRLRRKVVPAPTEVRMELWLRNGTPDKLTGLRVQNCVMLGYAPGFTPQTNDNKIFQSPYAAARSDDEHRWVITAWDPVQRCWGNEQCPCLHSDPQFPDCAPGETERLRGWLSFYEGTDIEAELQRIEATGWRK